jgi:hypothetical protein
MRLSWVAAAVVLALFPHSPARAAAPTGVNHQGLLVDTLGVPVNGQVDLLLSVWGHPTSTAPADLLYQEIHLDTLVIDGVFDVVLGQGSLPSGPFSVDLFGAADRWLQVQVESEVLAPRQKLQSVPYALQSSASDVASNANRLGGLSASLYQRAVSQSCASAASAI